MKREFTSTEVVCRCVACLAGSVLWVMYLRDLVDWIGFWGLVIAFLAVPGVLIHPVVYWFVEDSWPTIYVVIGLIAMFTTLIPALLVVKNFLMKK